ncbi:3-oxoacyl-ACP synthase [Streptomyces sp. XM83C]|jgi:3-oxoacyl-[acyl-carrier-protein] synthase-3|uniref:3-oxoacyl-[acyl-carrier-protein] synthase III C-terminal domain-containing protein n=1 Tax=Streptomyces thermocoprophilus TaxID=78356 RepID=A0ABV5VJ54_9ACTN|nr:3-oxoacyl-[acyl-carrier-protein] synthase III C-terminal domain-containing protein [Streptomyces sp. XM83C]MCK1822341.1 3-oxoacyl-ACP synthase [Streptomyces sp. XM83C]
MTITLSRVAARVPSGRDSVDEILARHDRPRAERRLFTRIFGLRTSPSLADGETLLELLLDAAEEALDGRRAALVLYGHTLLVQPFGHHDEFAGHLRERLGLPGVPVYGISRINCASVLRGTDLAERFLRRPGASPDDLVLVLGGDQGSMGDLSRIIPGFVVCGDAAAAVVMGRDGERHRGRYRYLGGAAVRDARFHRNLRMSTEESREFGTACVEGMAGVIDAAVRQAGLGRDDIDWIMPHMSNAFVWRAVSGALGIPMDHVYLDLLPEQGHTFGVDALMALAHADRTGRLTPGQRCVLAAQGMGAYFQAAVVEVTEDAA